MQVTVAIIDLKLELEHVMVPQLSSETYLQAIVKKTSSYSILSGPANVFLDNNFIAKVTAYSIYVNYVNNLRPGIVSINKFVFSVLQLECISRVSMQFRDSKPMWVTLSTINY